MKKFEEPKIEIVKFLNSDVITTSNTITDSGYTNGTIVDGDEDENSIY
ncbi:hypothetical protein [uncultured Eubacterium sp.]|nr:hypothetical protein [uncultured Eubacterium sp.]